MRLIDADLLIEQINKAESAVNKDKISFQFLKYIVDMTPSAEPVRNGKWIETHTWNGFTRVNRYTCSLCGHNTDRLAKTNFCPGCGAKMEEESDNG